MSNYRPCDFPGCTRDDAEPLKLPFDEYALCSRCLTWRELWFLLYVISRGGL